MRVFLRLAALGRFVLPRPARGIFARRKARARAQRGKQRR